MRRGVAKELQAESRSDLEVDGMSICINYNFSSMYKIEKFEVKQMN